jgi:hypothetical protein
VRGRSNEEAAVRVFVGQIELTFLIPVDEVIKEMAALMERIDIGGGQPTH